MTTIQHRRGSASQWATANPILAAGELGVELATPVNKFKMGDGTTPWNALPYFISEVTIAQDFIPKWKPSKVYALDYVVLNPSGVLVKANTAHTSGATYAPENWTATTSTSTASGNVTGPATAVSGDVVLFSGNTGKVVQDTGISIDADAALTANSNTRLPTQASVRSYVNNTAYTKAELGNPDADFLAAFNAAKA